MSKRPRDLDVIAKRSVAPRARNESGSRAPRQHSLPPVKTQKPAAATKPEAVAKPQSPPSKLPLMVFALIALIGLGASSAALMIHVMTGGKQTDFSEEVLAQELVPVEIPQDSTGETPTAGTDETEGSLPVDEALEEIVTPDGPTLMAGRGNPIVVSRQQSVTRQLAKIESGKIKAAAALKLSGELFRLTDNLSEAAGSLVSAAPGSQLNFAFNASGSVESGDDGDGAEPAVADPGNAAIIRVNNPDENQGRASRIMFTREIEDQAALTDVLVAGGFDGDLSKVLDAEVKRQLQIEKLGKGYAVAAVGIKPGEDDTGFVPVQLAIFKDGKFLRALAISETDSYVSAANPWFDQDPFHRDDEVAGTGKQRLLDVIYAAAVRNNLPTAVTGEIMMLLSRKHDLEQTANGGETMQVVYATRARDRKSGLGKVLYVKIDRGSEEPLECFAFQLEAKKPFECISGTGDGATTGGMTAPVRGQIVRKFGPGKDPVTGKKGVSNGVEWLAPPGAPVVAAYAGKVEFAGQDPKLGNVVRIAHDGGQVTLYGRLKTISGNIAEGLSLRSGQRIGTVGIADASGDARLYFEMQRGGQPVDPFGEYQARVEKGGAVESLVYRITTVESGNNCKAKNPLSTAAGLGQFIESTWLTMIRSYRPDLMAGRSRGEILNLRYECGIALEMTTALTRQNAGYIRSRGHSVTPGNLYLAHFLGPGGAASALGSSPSESVLNAFGAAVVRANPFLEGKSVGWLIEWAARKMAGKGKAPIIAPSRTATAQTLSLSSNKQFTKFRDAVLAMLE